MTDKVREDVVCETCGVLIDVEQPHSCYPDDADIDAINRAEAEDMEALFMHDNFCDDGDSPF